MRIEESVSELEALRMEVAAYREAFTAMAWARAAESYHAFDALRDDICPACGSAVRVVTGAEYPGELSAHGTPIGPNVVRLKPRYA